MRPASLKRAFFGAVCLSALGLVTLAAKTGSAEDGSKTRVVVDRVIARFTAPEAGGQERPHFIYERELAFEARLVAMGDATFRSKEEPFRRHHLQTALERHIAEELLAALRIDEKITSEEIFAQADTAKKMAAEQVGGEERLLQAAAKEGLGRFDVRRLFIRRARASFYLHHMVAPMLEPSELELRRVHRSGKTPFSTNDFGEVHEALRRWYVARNLRSAAIAYYQNARSRLKLRLF